MKKRKKGHGKTVRDLVECVPYRTTGGGQIPGLTTEDVQHESPNEKKAIAILALCHDVQHIESQPEQLIYQLDGASRRYTPDFRVKTSFCSGDLYIEAKSIRFLVHPDEVRKYGAIAADLKHREIPLVFLVDEQMETRPLADWVSLLYRYTAGDLREAAVERILDVLKSGPASVKQLLADGHALVDIWTMLARRYACVDYEQPFDPFNAMVSLPNQPFKGLLLENILNSGRFRGFLGELALGRRTTDKFLMASAETWRQLRHPYGHLSNVGGTFNESPLHPVGSEELAAPVTRHGGNQAVGLSASTTTYPR
jgi:hypothetical protein